MRYKHVDQGYVVRLERGEDVTSSLVRLAAEVGLESGFVTGLGSLCDVKLGYFDFEKQEYSSRVFEGDYELVSFTGNFSKLDGKPFLHVHAVVADASCNAYAGHLHSGVVAVTGEFFVISTGAEITREPDDETGLNLLKL